MSKYVYFKNLHTKINIISKEIKYFEYAKDTIRFLGLRDMSKLITQLINPKYQQV